MKVQRFLEQIPLTALSLEAVAELDLPVSVSQIGEAMHSLHPNKTPGLDGYPLEWYCTYQKFLAQKLLEVYDDAFEKGMLPNSLRETLIVLIPKPHKDHNLCESYHPISLINVDAKSLAKLLARRLNKVIASIINSDQTGFILMSSTTINLCRLFTVLQSTGPDPDTRIVVSLDTHKEFGHLTLMALLNGNP